MPTADELLNARSVFALSTCLRRAGGGPTRTLLGCASRLGGLRFSERVTMTRDAILTDLPSDFPTFATVLRAALDQHDFTGWMTFPVNEAVAVRGAESAGRALELLAALTPRLTAESAIRPFLRADLDLTLRTAESWTSNPDPHVRRLASESTRPRLPWAVRVPELTANPARTRKIIDALRFDDSEYVRRSVANHLNDVSHHDRDLTIDIAAGWARQPDDFTPSVLRRGLRTLVKKGDPEALRLLGYDPDAPTHVVGPELTDSRVTVGGHLEFRYTVANAGSQTAAFAVDYAIHFRRADGTHSVKVFTLSRRVLAPGEQWSALRRHSFAPLTTRRYHPGSHRVGLQINGRPHGLAHFDVAEPSHGRPAPDR